MDGTFLSSKTDPTSPKASAQVLHRLGFRPGPGAFSLSYKVSYQLKGVFAAFHPAFLSVPGGKFPGDLVYCAVQPVKPKSF